LDKGKGKSQGKIVVAEDKAKKVFTITITLPAWKNAVETHEKYEKLLTKAIPELEEEKANLEQKIAKLDDGSWIARAIYQLNHMIIEEKLGRVQSDRTISKILASMVEDYEGTKCMVFELQEEISKLPTKQRQKLNKMTRELAKKIETTLNPIKEAFEATKESFDEETEGQVGDMPPHRLWN